MMVLSDGRESFPIGLAVLIQYRSVTASQPPSQPPSHVDVAITLNAKASNLKKKVKIKVHALDIAPLRSETPPQKRSGMARVLNGFHSFTCTPTRSSAIRMSHTCICLPSRSWYSVTVPGGKLG